MFPTYSDWTYTYISQLAHARHLARRVLRFFPIVAFAAGVVWVVAFGIDAVTVLAILLAVGVQLFRRR